MNIAGIREKNSCINHIKRFNPGVIHITIVLTDNEIPNNNVEVTVPKLILGVARTFYVWKERISILGEINLVNTFDGRRNTVIKTDLWSLEPMIGTEIGYKGFIFLRAGLGNVQKALNAKGDKYTTTFQPNIGAGIKYKIFTLDYALTDIGDRSIALYSNIFSLKIDINKKPK